MAWNPKDPSTVMTPFHFDRFQVHDDVYLKHPTV
jgi:hypothetical protein